MDERDKIIYVKNEIKYPIHIGKISKRKDMTLAEKIDILDKIKNHPPNISQRKLAELLNVSKTTLSRLIKLQNELRQAWESPERIGKKRKRDGKEPDVEQALKKWYCFIIDRGGRITGPILKSKAEEFAKNMGRNSFQATDGWLSRWKARHGIKFKKTAYENVK